MIRIRGTLRTEHRNPACIAGSLQPDNLQSMETRAEYGQVIMELQGDSLRSIIASVDDYLMNLGIAEEVCRCASD
ncbi:MAG: hypothetical protein LUP99_00395 [Methanomicrobiales archaeon]|nr:hypothetical protein [Methanomicrobiales archaeon]